MTFRHCRCCDRLSLTNGTAAGGKGATIGGGNGGRFPDADIDRCPPPNDVLSASVRMHGGGVNGGVGAMIGEHGPESSSESSQSEVR